MATEPRAHDFVLFFDEKEGTSPIVRLLDRFDGLSILHQVESRGWEPFDRHNCGPMRTEDLRWCLGSLYSRNLRDFEDLNRVYMKTAVSPLAPLDLRDAVGFKMRFVPPISEVHALQRPHLLSAPAGAAYRRYQTSYGLFSRVMREVLQRNGVVVFVAVRQDVFRWGLSKYHGDGSGKPGHLQFDVATGALSTADIPPILVDCRRLEAVIRRCEALHVRKRRLLERLRRAEIQAYPLIYEDFVENPAGFFEDVLSKLGRTKHETEVARVLSERTCFRRVHSQDISTFVVNHTEVTERFGHRFVSWEGGSRSDLG